MPSTRFLSRTRAGLLALSVLIAIPCAFASEAKADIDLTGRWRGGPGNYADIVQTGSSVTVTWSGAMPPPSLSGTFDQTTLTAGACPSGYCLSMRQYGNGAVLDGVYKQNNTLTFNHERFTRCECYDGNEDDGDGCDSSCQVEPCYTCTPEPSVCTPSADAASCDDRNDCTTGETCSAGVCGGGSAVAPCVNLTGDWRVLTEKVSSGDRYEFDDSYVQRDGVVFNDGKIGSIDIATGAMDLLARGGVVCSASFSLDGAATLDNLSFSGSGTSLVPSGTVGAPSCSPFDLVVQAHRCEATEGCNLADCAGQPDGTPCDAGACKVEKACVSGICRSEPRCPACETCGGSEAYCETGPRPDCLGTTDADSSRLRVVDLFDGSRDQLAWTWGRGEAFDFEDIDPLGPNDLSLCVFFPGGGSGTYRTGLSSSTACAKAPCWTEGSSGYKYRNDEASSAITSLSLRSGPSGRSGIKLKGKGLKLSDQTPAIDVPLSFAVPVVTQLQSSKGACFEASFAGSGAKKNEDGKFSGSGGTLP